MSYRASLSFSLLVRMRPLYKTHRDNSQGTKHDCKFHLHSLYYTIRTLYYIGHSEWAEWGEGRVEWEGYRDGFPHFLSVRCGFSLSEMWIFSQWDVDFLSVRCGFSLSEMWIFSQWDVCIWIHFVCIVHLRRSTCLRFCNSYIWYFVFKTYIHYHSNFWFSKCFI